MTPERWERVKEILGKALELHYPERESYVGNACGSDPILRREVQRLLVAEESAGTGFLNRPAVPMQLDVDDTPRDAMLGRRVGAYQTAELIGVGGMGEVYRAFRADDQYRKQVALKLVRAGQDSQVVFSRFKNERQILASLDHPNIARLLDGGTTDEGAPYFVMELIEGQPLGQYCDDHRLRIDDRLKLFLLVCSAVQFAHQRLVVHRDIKPSNILVTADGIPKLLDFGVSKILDPDLGDGQVDPTLTVLRALTPAYASPEQIKGEPVTTASDVYSLGVVLYELLAGHSPYRVASRTPHELAHAVCDLESEKPSLAVRHPTSAEAGSPFIGNHGDPSPGKTSKQLRGDLDNIVLKALRKEPARRYGSVEEFAGDIRRHLEDQPVLARKGTFSYRASKFIRRHTAGIVATALVVAALLVGMGTTLAQKRRAERRFNDVRKLANALIFDLHDPIRQLPGSIHVEKMLIDTSLKYLDSLAQETESDSSLQRELAEAYQRLGNAQGSPYGANLGDSIGALASYRKALRLRQTALKSDPQDVQGQIRLASNYRTIGSLLAKMGDLSGARDSVRQALGITQALPQQAQDEPRSIHELGVDFLTLGDVEGNSVGAGIIENPELALQYHRKALEVNQKWIALRPTEQIRQQQAAYENDLVAADLIQCGRPEEAIQYANQALTILEQMAKGADDSSRIVLKDTIATTHSQIGSALLVSGNPRKAIAEFSAELAIIKYLYEADTSNAAARLELSSAYVDLGAAWINSGRAKTGLQFLQQGIEMAEQRPITDAEVAITLASGYIDQGEALEKLGDEPQALRAYAKGERLFASPDLFKPGKFADTLQAAAGGRIAGALAKLGKLPQAEEKYRGALRQVEAAAAATSPNLRAQYILADLYAGLGDLLSTRAARVEHGAEAVDTRNEARRYYEKSLEAWQQLPLHTATASILFDITAPETVAQNLARCRQAIQRHADSEAHPTISPR